MADETKQIAVRLSAHLLKQVDERAAYVGLSRNAWLAKALEWALEQPLRTVKREERV